MMWKNMAPAAVFEMNSVMKVPTRQMVVITMMGLVPQTSRMPNARRSAMPVFCMARPRTTLPAKTMRMSQLMARMACSALQQRQMSMAAAAKKAHWSRGMMPRAETATMAIMMAEEMMVPLPMLGTSVESKNWRSFENSSVCSLLLPICKSNVSPASRMTSRGELLMRLPRRDTATSVRLCLCSNWFSFIVVPIRALPNLT